MKKQKDKFSEEQGRTFNIVAKNESQKQYLAALKIDTVIIALGPAGTGKTYLAAAYAATELTKGKIDKIILTRANVPTGKTLGHFPGTIEEKLGPWLSPITSVIKDVITPAAYDCQIKLGNIQLIPLETIRGRSFDRSIILVDEAQNLTFEEIKAITTRIGEHSKMVLMGDISQSDLKTGKDNALYKLTQLINKHNISNTSIVEFRIEDIVRSGICAAFVKAYFKEDSNGSV